MQGRTSSHLAALQRRALPQAGCWSHGMRSSRRTDHHASTRVHYSKRGDVLLIADGIGKSHTGDKQLFSNLTFSVVSGDKMAIVGANGSGKSTLLQIIAGVQEHDNGSVSRNKGAKVGYLPQDAEALGNEGSVLQAVLTGDSEMARAVQEYQRALATAAGGITKDLEAAIERMNTYNAWQIDAEAKRILEAVGLPDPNAPLSSLSGGQRRRVALATALLGNNSLLVLDEPTNHMDVEMIAWMERELTSRTDMAVVLVTHDRAFMEGVADRLLELDSGKAVVHNFGGPGSYELWKQAREFRRHAQANAAADARTLFKREAEWMSRQPKARSTKAAARVNAFYDLEARTKDVPAADLRADFGGMEMVRQGNKVVVLSNVSYTAPDGRQLLRDFTFEIMPGERLGVAGPNGSGKSTLLDIITGVKQLASGTRDVGETTVIGYFQQHPPPVRPDLRIIDYIRNVADDRAARAAGVVGEIQTPETLLQKVGFPIKMQFQKVESLSGGERRRLHLAAVLSVRPNLLVLDEPTNDLDLATIEVLEEVLQGYKGALLVCSHDRAFMENCTDRLLVMGSEDGKVKLFDGTYSSYIDMQARQQQEQQAQQERMASGSAASSNGSKATNNGSGKGSNKQQKNSSSSSKPAATAAKPPPKNRRIGFHERQEYDKLTKELDVLNAKRDKQNEELMALAQSGSDLKALEELSLALGALSDDIDAKTDRWLELAELAGDL